VRILWLLPLLVLAVALGRTWWVYRGSSDWPVADGRIAEVDVQRIQGAVSDGGHYFRAIFTYSFEDLNGNGNSGTWSKNFSTEQDARDFASRELPVGKQVSVRFKPKDASVNSLELDSWTYTNDRPTSLNL
jgi:hypothetical protein